MRRPQSAFGLVAVMSSLLVVTLFAAPASAAFAPLEPEAAPVFSAKSASCTKWGSSFVPPKTIRVLRTKRDKTPWKVAGTVQVVDFYEYVATVMAAEWPERYPLETLKAGAVATKQFAWYYILNPRGQTKWVDGEKVCYDVVDTTVDQAYYPDVTWDVSLRKFKRTTQSSRFFLTGYRAGSSGAACGEDATGFKLFHNSTRKCGYDGLKYREILRLYLKPNLEIVEPGRNDTIGSKHGDASAMEKDAGQFHSHVWTPGRTPPEPGSSTDVSISNDNLVGYRSADMNGDGHEDLVWLKQTGTHTGKVKVALSNGVDYQPAEDWWAGDTIVPLGPARLLLGDFHADHRVDVAILSRGDAPDKSKLVVLKRKKYANDAKFFGPTVWWAGPQDPSKI
ncbi:MAG: SpoIID/LytB domain-containing protein, partial [Chloroflexota bacterium]|nr:SpoIID/LytB domain-containing protein [Chloroflexota bacterium]